MAKIATSFKLEETLHKDCKIGAIRLNLTLTSFVEEALDFYLHSVTSPGWEHSQNIKKQ